MPNNQYKADFNLNESCYFLSHSVGRPLKSSKASLEKSFFSHWEKSEPWDGWLEIVHDFRRALSRLFNVPMEEFCPQTNLSSAVVKLVMSLDVLKKPGAIVLLSEIDFPSMGFAIQHALPDTCKIKYIPKHLDITDPNVWNEYLKKDISLAFVTHAYSNTGQLAPLAKVVRLANDKNILTLIDVAQSAGIVDVDLSLLKPSFMVGSSVKWLCGGPGAAFLWVNSENLDECSPLDVGWFSHESPFEFNIHDFRFHQSSLRFWGGTPSVIPYALAAESISYMANIGSVTLREHNQALIDRIVIEVGDEFLSPRLLEKRSGTIVLGFGDRLEKIMQVLKKKNIMADVREQGIRVSPHIYNELADMEQLISAIVSV